MTKFKTFLLEVVIFVCFLFIGAAVFQALEQEESRYTQSNNNELLLSVLHQISHKYNITVKELNSTVEQLRTSLRNAGEGKWEKWSFVGSYLFAGTVAFTIGIPKNYL